MNSLYLINEPWKCFLSMRFYFLHQDHLPSLICRKTDVWIILYRIQLRSTCYSSHLSILNKRQQLMKKTYSRVVIVGVGGMAWRKAVFKDRHGGVKNGTEWSGARRLRRGIHGEQRRRLTITVGVTVRGLGRQCEVARVSHRLAHLCLQVLCRPSTAWLEHAKHN